MYDSQCTLFYHIFLQLNKAVFFIVFDILLMTLRIPKESPIEIGYNAMYSNDIGTYWFRNLWLLERSDVFDGTVAFNLVWLICEDGQVNMWAISRLTTYIIIFPTFFGLIHSKRHFIKTYQWRTQTANTVLRLQAINVIRSI